MQLQSTSPIRTKLVPIRRRSSFAEILDLRRPIFPGFLFTAVFWSVTAFTLLSIPATLRAARRTIRHRRDQCPTCGYTRTGLAPCPECGQPDAAHS
ncbi:MAG: hypothetical protein ACREJO_11685 [Phycisphaerales bacterium]